MRIRIRVWSHLFHPLQHGAVMQAIETVQQGDLVIKVYQDDDPSNPRTDYDNGTIILVKPNRYFSGDKDCDLETEEEVRELYQDDKVLCILPLYAYIHGSVALSTGPFGCRFDSGQAGWVVITQSKSDLMGYEGFTQEQLEEAIKAEVKTFHEYLNGEVYGFQISKGEEILESCWGYIGDKKGCLEDAKSLAAQS